jgi:hypothetical protein
VRILDLELKAVPEPAAVALLSIGLFGLLVIRRQASSQQSRPRQRIT